MKRLFPLLLLLASTGFAFAQTAFPGLRAILTEAEWKRADLERLTPDQIGVIDAALIRHYIQTMKSVTASANATTPPVPAPGATVAEIAVAKSRFWERFGFGKGSVSDWRSQTPLVAKVTAWQGANAFVLDIGQVWEGVEKIPYDLLGRDVTIEARPLDSFALKLDENSAVIRVRRLK